jgi:hypothetical protein
MITETTAKPEEKIILTDENPASNVLPDSRLKAPKDRWWHPRLGWMVPLFCASCGKEGEGGSVPEEHCDFAFYICEPCAEKLGPIMGTYAEPDVLFWKRVNAAQMEEFGRILTADEQVEALKDGNHILAKLARDRK